MSPEPIENDQEYIEGLLQHNPNIVEQIYQKFASKEKRFILQKSGTIKDAAYIFEEALMDIYYFARSHPLKVSDFEPFLQLLCKRIWEQELERRGQRIPGLEAEELSTLSRDDIQDVENVLKEGEKRRLAYQFYLTLSDECKEILRWSLVDNCLQEDVAAETNIPVTELPERRSDCYRSLFRDIDAKLKVASLPDTDLLDADRFLNGQMPEAERQSFSERLQDSPLLSQQVKRFNIVRQLLAQRICPDSRRDELQHLLYMHRNAWYTLKDNSGIPILRYVILVALVAATIAILLFISPWRKNIYKQFASTEMQIPDVDSIRLPEAAIHLFNHGHFNEAIKLLNDVLKTNPGNVYARFYRSVALIDLNQLDTARQDLLLVYNNSSELRSDAAFYIALSYLKEGHRQECLEWLLKIQPGAPTYIKAQKLIEELKH
ncbi:tetratricopeptide repeat protein [Chitinophaga silvatica]|uniref:Tetratricopeptide repeat protein n=1 Tax=Chitinophaga silvatica TaxID=2282649 RepID=A0A3E1Y875_9BACT|nr:tetratricopeptide repeat protein [Chitinophaga silvatica]RFS21375.1 tetratricopeptide repeat protein [Chitinophaga silvatica]